MRVLCIRIGVPVLLAILLNPVLSSMLSPGPATTNTASFTVQANRMFSPTGVHAAPNTKFQITAAGLANIADEDDPYVTDMNGTLMKAPLPNSGAWAYFKDSAAPVGIPPLLGKRKFPLGGSQLDTAPFGALVAGFSTTAIPTSLADFPDGFHFVGTRGELVSPASGGYLFFAVNDINDSADNDGYFLATRSRD